MSLSSTPLPDRIAEPRAAGDLTARPIRGRRVVGPLLLYFLIALGILFPYRNRAVRPVGDLPVALTLTLQADHALREGQFPIRIGPECMRGLRYPIFQFYGNFPYTVTGALSIVFHNPYTGWKIATLAALTCAGYFMMRLSLWLSGNDRAAVLSGVVFLCAPYLMTDLNARGAFAEMIAFCLMPAAFYATLRCLESTHWRRVLWCAVAWTLIGLSHNISYLYGVLFAGLLCLPFLLSRRAGPRWLRLGIAGLIHAALMLWYVVPQFKILSMLIVRAGTFDPFIYAAITPLSVLLASVQTNNAAGSGTPNLGMQVGWPILAGVFLAVVGLVLPRRTAAPRRLMIWLLLAGFVLTFFIAWSPFDFWKHLPTPLWFVQFPYRLLMFVVLFGSGLFACGLARLFPRRVPRWAALPVLAGVGIAVASYVPRTSAQWPEFVTEVYQHPQVNQITEYLTTAAAMAPGNVSDASPDNYDWDARLAEIGGRPAKGPLPRIAVSTSQVRYGARTHVDYLADHALWLEMPMLDYPGLIEVRDNGRKMSYHDAGRFVTLQLGRGLHQIAITFVGVKWANVVSLIAWIGVIVLLLVPVLQPAADRIGARIRALVWSAADAPFSPRDAIVAFLLLLAFTIVPMYPSVRHWWSGRPPMRVSASASLADPENAFDEDPATAWVAKGGGPATVTAELARPAKVHGLVLQPRVTDLNECWQHLTLTLFKDGRQVYKADYDFPGAAADPQETVAFPAVSVDRIQMLFSNPVLTTHDGKRVPAEMVSPGYREIQILWGS